MERGIRLGGEGRRSCDEGGCGEEVDKMGGGG